MDKKTTVVLVDDHEVVREGLKEILEHSGDFEVVGSAGDGMEAIEVVESVRPDIVIMDVMLPKKDGIEASRAVKDRLPDTRVLILTASRSLNAVLESVTAGAEGYLHKASSRNDLLVTLRAVSDGQFAVPRDLLIQATGKVREMAERMNNRGPDVLTLREREIAKMFAEGHTYAEIAAARGNKPLTIRNAVYSIQNKLGLRTKLELAVWTVRSGLLDTDRDIS